MLSPDARNLLKIPQDADLSLPPGEVYDLWFARRAYETRLGGGWSFGTRGEFWDREPGFDVCLEHRTAQFHFALDEEFRVYVFCGEWIPIASSFGALVEEDALLAASNLRGDKRRGFGTFPSFAEFVARNQDYLSEFKEIPSRDGEFARYFRGPGSIIVASRFYSEEYAICGIEIF